MLLLGCICVSLGIEFHAIIFRGFVALVIRHDDENGEGQFRIDTWWLMISTANCIVRPVSISLGSCLAAFVIVWLMWRVRKKAFGSASCFELYVVHMMALLHRTTVQLAEQAS